MQARDCDFLVASRPHAHRSKTRASESFAPASKSMTRAIPSFAGASASVTRALHLTRHQSSAPITPANESIAPVIDSLARVSQLTCRLSVTAHSSRPSALSHRKQVNPATCHRTTASSRGSCDGISARSRQVCSTRVRAVSGSGATWTRLRSPASMKPSRTVWSRKASRPS
jgi:hypothetical protein